MVQRYMNSDQRGPVKVRDGRYVLYRDYQELEAENAKLRQQRDAANAQLDFLMEHLKKEE